MVIPQENLWAQSIGRLIILKEYKPDPGTETTIVMGEIEVNSGAGYVYARNLRLKSIQEIYLTANPGGNGGDALPDLLPSKYLINKGRKNNYASIYVWDCSADALQSGSHYVNFLAMGE